MIEGDDAVHFGARQVELIGDQRDRGGGHMPQRIVHPMQHFEQAAGARLVDRDDAQHGFTLGWFQRCVHGWAARYPAQPFSSTSRQAYPRLLAGSDSAVSWALSVSARCLCSSSVGKVFLAKPESSASRSFAREAALKRSSALS